METTLSKGNRIAAWVLTGLLTAMLLMSAAAKFMAPEMAANFEKWGLGDWRVIIAVGEIVSALLFLVPLTHRVGLLLLSSYFGGAIMIHLSHGEPFTAPALILAAVWATGFVRDPKRLGFKA